MRHWVIYALVAIHTAGGKRLMAVSPKDGFLYGFDLADNKQLYKTPVTTIDNVGEPFSTEKEVHFCPGAGGGEEWNSPAPERQPRGWVRFQSATY